MSRRLRSAALVAASMLALTGASMPSASAAIGKPSDAFVQRAATWIATQQQPDGGFETAGFAGLETPDAVLALAAAGQQDPAWNTTRAREVVLTVRRDGKSPLDYLDDYAEGDTGTPLNQGQAAKLIIVAKALGLDPSAFDPKGNGPTDLVAAMGQPKPDGTFGAFNATLVAAVAWKLVHNTVPTATVDRILRTQQANGSWNFAGDPAGLDGKDASDPDTTGVALQALAASGLPVTNPVVARALIFLAGAQLGDGFWGESFEGKANPNSTAQAMLGIAAYSYETTISCWRDAHAASLRGRPYPSPVAALAGVQASDGHIVSPFDSFGVNTLATSQAVQAYLETWLPVVRQAGRTCPGDGYVLFGPAGEVFPFGPWGQFFGSRPAGLKAPVVGGDLTTDGLGYWLFGADGGVFAYGDATFHGSAGSLPLVLPVVGGTSTPAGKGYLLGASDGGIFAYGDAVFAGSMGGKRLNAPMVGVTATPTGKGYWTVATDGGIFAFGDAAFHGSMGGKRLNAPIVGMAATATGKGYWLFASDGGIFAFGDAPFYGSAGALRLVAPIAGGIVHPGGRGYWLIGRDGGVFSYGEAPFRGTPGGSAVIVGGAS